MIYKKCHKCKELKSYIARIIQHMQSKFEGDD